MDKHSFFEVVAQESEVTVHIYGVIGQSWFEESVQAQKLVKEIDTFAGKFKKAKFRINSPGGSLYDGLPIYNAIKRLPIDTEVYIDGMAYSMAAIIALAGKKIIGAKNSMFLLHSPLGAAFGNAKDFREIADNLDKYGESLMQSVIDRTGLTEEDVKSKWFDYEDHLMTANEAKDLGFFDEVTDQEAKINKGKAVDDIKNFFQTDDVKNLIPFQSLCNSITTAINAFTQKEEPEEVKKPDEQNQAKGQSGQAANNNSQIKTEMKQFKNVNAALGVESLEAVDGAVSLNEEQLGALDSSLGADPDAELQAQLETANATIGERDATITDLESQVETASTTIEERDGTIAGRDETIAGLNQTITDLKGEAAGAGTQVHKSKDGNKNQGGRAISEKYDNPFDALDEVAQEYTGKSINN
jgi:ATP-dependent protease ClpP protease subunit